MRTLKTEAAFSQVEMLVSLAIGGLLITGMCEVYLTSANSAMVQNETAQMQSTARNAMDIMVRNLQESYGAPVISTSLTPNDTISFSRLEDSGYASAGGGAASLVDTRKSWRANAFAPSGARTYVVQIVSGTGAGQTQSISGNTGFTLNLSSSWNTTPDATSQYIVLSPRVLTRAAGNILRASAFTLATDVTSLSFALSTPNTIDIALTARTGMKDPRIQRYVTYSLSETAVKRN